MGGVKQQPIDDFDLPLVLLSNHSINITPLGFLKLLTLFCIVRFLLCTFVVAVSSVWLWCVNTVSSRSLTVSTTSLVMAATSRPSNTISQFTLSDNVVFPTSAFTFQYFPSHLLQWRGADSGGGARPGWRSPRRRRSERCRARPGAGRRNSPRGRSADPESEGKRTPSTRPHTAPPKRGGGGGQTGQQHQHDESPTISKVN